ncbi:ATP-binding protein [Streptomyces sp. NBC_00670]|uniref:ATP-binding protein n=1 Tax=Streptomyces sp. NBC_00670 TaxID=2975804 RepID=UPI002E326636|nr:ATP-binding protein [Streptomyces sp. NBC_00670]
MTGGVRLLPWVGAHGQPCLLLTDGDGTVSRFADRVEDVQLRLGELLLGRTRESLTVEGARNAPALVGQLADALADALLIARSRGARADGGPVPTTGCGLAAPPLACVRFSLPGGDLAAAPVARHRVREAARSWGLPGAAADDLETITGELVANALEHSGSHRINVACALTPGRVTVGVTDEGRGGMPVTADPQPDPEREHGRGLLLTAALSARWGTHRAADGALTVWAELTTEPAGTTGRAT